MNWYDLIRFRAIYNINTVGKCIQTDSRLMLLSRVNWNVQGAFAYNHECSAQGSVYWEMVFGGFSSLSTLTAEVAVSRVKVRVQRAGCGQQGVPLPGVIGLCNFLRATLELAHFSYRPFAFLLQNGSNASAMAAQLWGRATPLSSLAALAALEKGEMPMKKGCCETAMPRYADNHVRCPSDNQIVGPVTSRIPASIRGHYQCLFTNNKHFFPSKWCAMSSRRWSPVCFEDEKVARDAHLPTQHTYLPQTKKKHRVPSTNCQLTTIKKTLSTKLTTCLYKR